jgi:nucleotide-binding universal stress UspA family protein
MLPIKTVLHPTDFSDRSRPAFNLACALARDYGARLVLVHVERRPLVDPLMGVVPADADEYRQGLRNELAKLKGEAPGLQAECRLMVGDNESEEISRCAHEVGADIIVLGTHGRSGLARALMGSVAEQVTRSARCPVVTVRMPFPGSAESRAAPVQAARKSEVIIF